MKALDLGGLVEGSLTTILLSKLEVLGNFLPDAVRDSQYLPHLQGCKQEVLSQVGTPEGIMPILSQIEEHVIWMRIGNPQVLLNLKT